MTELMRNPDKAADQPSQIMKDIERAVISNRQKIGDVQDKCIKDLRRIFDQDSSRMNQAIFNNAPPEEIYAETLKTVSTLVEILVRSQKK